MDTEKYALIVIDMQEHFRDGMADKIVHDINCLIDLCHTLSIPVIYTQHGHRDPGTEEETQVLVKWWGAQGSIQHGSKAWRLLPELHRKHGDLFISNKTTYDAFHGTELLDYLQSQGTTHLVVSGVMTNCCCETTARSAFVNNFDIVFLSDGTATSSEEMHHATLLNIGFAFGRVMTCAELKEELVDTQ